MIIEVPLAKPRSNPCIRGISTISSFSSENVKTWVLCEFESCTSTSGLKCDFFSSSTSDFFSRWPCEHLSFTCSIEEPLQRFYESDVFYIQVDPEVLFPSGSLTPCLLCGAQALSTTGSLTPSRWVISYLALAQYQMLVGFSYDVYCEENVSASFKRSDTSINIFIPMQPSASSCLDGVAPYKIFHESLTTGPFSSCTVFTFNEPTVPLGVAKLKIGVRLHRRVS